MTKSEIISAIEAKVRNTSYSSWTIGITDDPAVRKTQHENEKRNVAYWSHWKTDSETIGREVERHFLDKGMKGDTGGGGKAGYVYVF